MHDLVQTLLATPAPSGGAPDTEGLATWLRGIVGPLLLVIISIVAGFFLFTKEITRFVQFFLLAVVVMVLFYFPTVIVTVAQGVAAALGIK